MSDNDDRRLTVPKRCARGHELTPRTTTIKTRFAGKRGEPIGWECVRCLRALLWQAHHPSKRVPADVLAEELFIRQASALVNGRPADWTRRVVFRSGWQYADPDPTPELRAARVGVCANGHSQHPDRVYVARDDREFCKDCRAEHARRRRAGQPKPPDPRPHRLRERFAADLASVVSA